MEIAPPSQRRKVAAKNEQEDHKKIERLEVQIKDLQIEVAFVREEAAQECPNSRASTSFGVPLFAECVCALSCSHTFQDAFCE